jgi:DNA-binding HxlR family transcriptional regulator
VLRREVTDARPPRVEYLLTSEGLALRALVEALAVWARA